MDYTQHPGHIALNTKDLYQEIYFETDKLLKNNSDIKEMFNQALDYTTNEVYHNGNVRYRLNVNMLKCKDLKSGDGLNDEGIRLYHIFEKLCFRIMSLLKELNARPIIDMTTSHEIYPYYFHDLIRGSVILKRL